jgi:hypothetical protein
MVSGAAGDGMPMAGTNGQMPTGSAGDGAAGTGEDPPTGAAGDPTGASGTNGGAGVTGSAGTSGAAGTMGNAGTNGAAGTGTAGTGAAGTGIAGSGAAGTGAAGTGAAGTGAAGSGGKAGSGGAGSPGTGTQGEIGCSDNTREGYLDRFKYPRIAACEGAWDEPGLSSLDARAPQCNRRAGNDGDRSDGRDCSVTDLCASGWSVCDSGKTVLTAAPTGCADAIAPYGQSHVFFLTRQRGTGLVCDANNQVGTNNLYGCGNIGSPADKSCAPFKTMLRDTDCQADWPWTCAEGPIGTSQNEYGVVTKAGPNKGGVLCCKN